jgi:hypothetical protein
MKTLVIVLLGVMLIIWLVVGIAIRRMYSSAEFQTAVAIAQEYATNTSMSRELKCVNASTSWAKRGRYKLCCFLFQSKRGDVGRLIVVRYTTTCPPDTFEVGTIPDSHARECSPGIEIGGRRLMGRAREPG